VTGSASQMVFGPGVKRGEVVESLPRAIRAPRVGEGATEVHARRIAGERPKAAPA